MKNVYQELATLIDARIRCEEELNWKWYRNHKISINRLINLFPHGSGIDGTTSFDFDKSHGEKLIIHSVFHAMYEMGGYDRWINFTMIVTSSLIHNIDIKIVGNFGKYQDVKECLYEVFSIHLNEEIKQQ